MSAVVQRRCHFIRTHGRWWLCDFQRKIIPCNATQWHNSSLAMQEWKILSIDINLNLPLHFFHTGWLVYVWALNISQMYLCTSRNRLEIEILYSSHRLTLVFRRNSTWKDVEEISLIFSTLKKIDWMGERVEENKF
mgnify:CR=1 FL=1